MKKPRLRLVRPSTVNRTVTPRRRPNRDLRTREHLNPKEVDRLIEATKGNRWAHRDATMLLLAYRHGLRASPGVLRTPAVPPTAEVFNASQLTFPPLRMLPTGVLRAC
jgi:hypothetical protein